MKRRNPRQYTATIRGLPNVTALWQRQNDIVRGVRQGALDFAIVDDIFYFIEINPTGEWAWLVDAAGQHIYEAICDWMDDQI